MSPILTLSDLKSYFSSVASDLGCSFEFGNSERILNRQLSNLVYPVLWLEVPDIRMLRDGTLHRQFQAAFLCLSDVPADDFDGQDEALDAMYTLTEQVLQRMQADSESQPVPFIFDIAGARSEYKGMWSADDDWGWRTEFDLVGAACDNADCCA